MFQQTRKTSDGLSQRLKGLFINYVHKKLEFWTLLPFFQKIFMQENFLCWILSHGLRPRSSLKIRRHLCTTSIKTQQYPKISIKPTFLSALKSPQYSSIKQMTKRHQNKRLYSHLQISLTSFIL